MNRNEALKKVQMYSFALVDTGLFLDTHPTNKAALAFFADMQQKYVEAVADFEAQFGPLTADETDTENGWAWATTPWPWEMED